MLSLAFIQPNRFTMQKILTFFLLFCLQQVLAQDFKVVGYLPTYRFNYLNDIEFERVNHVNIAFANPDSSGTLSFAGVSITNAVNIAHQHNCKVFVSLAGGYLTPNQDATWNYLAQPANRPAFIQKIVQYVQSKNLDGVDVDLEWQYIQSWYSPFILELKTALNAINKPLTAALPGEYRYPQITNQALAAFDWVNMMVYDLTGPWAPSNPGQHSPYWWAQECIQYWQNQGVAPAKLTLGVPFYGYDFGAIPVSSFTFRGIVNQDPANADIDNVGLKYWNGIPTIQEKTELALAEVSGIMIWELGHDAFAANIQYSLLRAIDEVVDAATTSVASAESPVLKMFPNPTTRWLSIRQPGEAAARVVVVNMQNQVVLEQHFDAGGQIDMDLSNEAAGLYGVLVYTGEQVFAGKFVKL